MFYWQWKNSKFKSQRVSFDANLIMTVLIITVIYLNVATI